jgi:branched-chain amino acid transport system substrate-binding protein
LFLTSGATSPLLPAQVPKYLFLACFGDNVQAAAGAEWAYRTRSARTAAVLYQASTTYARLLQRYFRTAFETLGGRIVAARSFTTQSELGEAIRAIGKPDLVYLSSGDPDYIVDAIRKLRTAGFAGPILGGDGFDSEALWQQHPEIDGVFFTTHAYLGEDNPDPRIVAFREAYARAYPGIAPDAFAALGYDTVRLLAAAIARAKSVAPSAVLEALAQIDRFEGVTGIIAYAPGTRIPNKSVSILRVAGGRRSLVEQTVPARVPPP